MQAVIPQPRASRDEAVLDAAATAELRSEHPLGKAIVAYARAPGRASPEPERFDYTPGRASRRSRRRRDILVGNRALLAERRRSTCPALAVSQREAASEVFVARDGRLLGAIVVADTVRPEAQARHRGARPHGHPHDPPHRRHASRWPRRSPASSGSTEVEADLLPEDKLARVKDLVGAGPRRRDGRRRRQRRPALTEANVGVAMGSGTDVARESADVVLLGNDLVRFVETLAIARRTRRHHLAELRRAPSRSIVGIGFAAGLSEPAPGRLHPRGIGVGVHPELGPTPARRLSKRRGNALDPQA